MKTEQEQIEEIVKILLEASKKCFDADCDCCDKQYEKDCAQYNKAVALVQAGYGDVSEYKAEIERLKEETSNIRKDTAKKILQTLYDQCYEINDETGESMGYFVSDDDILCLAKQYGVEVNV